MLVNLDDFLLVHQDQSKLISQAAEAVKILESLGWRQLPKVDPQSVPAGRVLRHNLEHQQQHNVLGKKKRERILESINLVLTERMGSLRQIQKLLGQLNFANFAILRGRLHCRHLQIFSHRFNRQRPRERRMIPSRAIADLEW